MSYQVLARKWRPRTFDDMVGQQHVLQALHNALKQQRVHHAYLLTGTRGVGKTTLGRILAKCLNCETGISPTPCDTCDNCQAINQGRFVDLLEVDAASRTRVEDTRDLLDNVQYAPTQGRFKVYLIDEVHMLSASSFNALLKTLEEPPEHVKFILATTDPQKLPVTVLSRCLQFHLKHIPAELISQQLTTILTAENIDAEPDAVADIAKAADGSLRDALTLLEQAIAYSDRQLTAVSVRQMLGTLDNNLLLTLLEQIQHDTATPLLHAIDALATEGVDFYQAFDQLLSLLHQMAIIQVDPQRYTQCPRLQQLSQHLNADTIQLFYQIGLIARRDLPLAPTPRIGFEMACLRLYTFAPAQLNPGSVTKTEAKLAITSTPTAKATEKATTTDTTSLDWTTLVNQLTIDGLTRVLAQHCSLRQYADNHLELDLDPNHRALMNPQQEQRLLSALN